MKNIFPLPPRFLSQKSKQLKSLRSLRSLKKPKLLRETFLAIFFLSFFLVSIFLFLHPQVKAAWFNDSWTYRKSIPITNNTTTETNVYIIAQVNIADATKAQADDGDFRFTTQNGQNLSYFISAGVGSTAPTFHIQLLSFPAGSQTLYAYYGNPSTADGFQTADFSGVATNYTVGTLGNEEKSPGPIDYWKLDEGSGSTVNDSTVNAKNGTLGTGSSAPSWTSSDLCISGNCLKFDGNDYVSIGSSVPNIQTVSFWVKPTSTTASMINLTSGAYITATSGTITATGFTTPTYYVNGLATTSPVLTANVWNYITVTTGTAITGNTVAIANANSAFTTGFIDDVKFYAYARSAAQVKADYAAGKASSATNKGAASALGAPPNAGGTLSNGLVGFWKMDDASGNATDSSGNAYTLTNNGTVPFNSGKFGNAPKFNGASTFFNIGTTIASVQTISFWAKPANTTDNYINLTSAAYINSSSGTISATGITPSTIYVNGVQSSTIAASSWQLVTVTTTSAITVNAFEVGRANNAYTVNTSQIDDVRLYNRVLSPKEISNLYNSAPGPIGFWKMDENTGLSANDSSGNGNTGTLSFEEIADPQSPEWKLGKIGNALRFNPQPVAGTHPLYVEGSISASTAVTLEAWIFIHTAPADGNASKVVALGTSGSSYHFLDILATGTTLTAEMVVNNDDLSIAASTTTIQPSTWYHLEGTYDATAGKVKLYVNGQLEATTNYSTAMTSTDTFDIATDLAHAIGRSFDGTIDNVMVYNYARSYKQIIEDINNGHPAPGSPIGSSLMHLKFNEGYGSTAHSSGLDKNLNGTLSGSTTPSWTTSGKIGKALSFSGTSAYVGVGNSVPVQITSDLTLSAWINLTTNDAVHDIIAKDGASGDYGYRLFTDANGKLNMEVSSNGTAVTLVTGATTLATSTWYHVLGTYIPSSSLIVYLNGKPDKTNTASIPASIFNSTANLEVGSENTGASNLMSGSIDEVKLYNFALNGADVKTEYNQGSPVVLGSVSTDSSGNPQFGNNWSYCPPGDGATCTAPIGYWNFEEGSGLSANDSSGNGYTGTLSNEVIASPPSPLWNLGKIGSALKFNHQPAGGTGPNYVEGSITSLTAVTLEAWVYMTASPTDVSPGKILALGASGTSYHYIDLSNTSGTINVRMVINNSGAAIAASTTSIQLNTWYHFEGTYDATAGKVKLYVNGQLEATTNYSTAMTSTDTFDIATDITHATGRSFDGIIDNAIVYNYARTPAQIAWDYNNGKPVGWWKMNECEGTTIHDSSGFGESGTLSIGATVPQTAAGTCTDGLATSAWYNGATGKFNASLNFDGADDYINVAYTIPTNSVSFWVKPTSNTASMINLTSGAYITAATGTITATGFTTPTYYVNGMSTTTPTLTANVWNHIVVTTGTSITSNAVTFGKANSAFTTGQIDDIQIFNYALTSQQVKLLYNQNSAVRFGPSSGSP